MKPILLFDIDGTLLNVNREFLKKCIEKIISDLNASNLISKPKSFAGKTDREIFSHLAKNHPEPGVFYHLLKSHYIRHMNQYFKKAHLNVIQGVETLLEYSKKKNLDIGLCTGNFRETAFTKVNRAGFTKRFQFGGFGCHHKDRAYLPGEAHADYLRAKKMNNGEGGPLPGQYVVIGDTPNDIRCARYFGAKAVAVTTGHFSEKELLEHKPDLLVDNLTELPEWLEHIYRF